MSTLERTLLWIIRVGLFLLLFTPLIISKSLFFPFITGKNFFFRIIVEIIFGVWCALAILQPRYRSKPTLVLIAFGVFIFILIIATVFGADPYHSFWSNFERMEGLITHFHLFALFLVLAHPFKTKKEWFYLFNISVCVSLITAFYGFLQSRGIIEMVSVGRPYATMGNSIYLGVYLLLHLFIITALFQNVRAQWARISYAAIFFFELYVFFIAASRGAFLGLSAGVVVAALLTISMRSSRSYKIVALVLIGIVFALFIMIGYFPESSFVRSNQIFSRLSTFSIASVKQDSRVMIWGIAFNAIKEHPILGWGPENFIIPYAKYYNPNLFTNEPWFDRVHNMLLEWLVATGIVGFVAYLWIFLVVFYSVFLLLRKHKLDTSSAIIIVSFVVAYITQNVFVFDEIVTYLVFIIVIGYVHFLLIESKETKTKLLHSSHAGQILSVVPIVVTPFLVYFLNVNQILASRQLIVALESLNTSTKIEQVVGAFDKAIAYNTFGTTEVRERLADAVVQSAISGKQLGPNYLVVLNKSIEEMKKEVDLQSAVAKYPLFLGKLETINLYQTGGGFEEGERAYLRTIDIAPRYVQNYLGLAELYLAANKPDKAVDAALRAYDLTTSRNTRGALFFPLIGVQLLAGHYDDALKFIRRYNDEDINALIGRKNVVSSSPEITTMSRRALMFSKDLNGRLNFFLELEKMTIHPYIFIGLAQTYGELGNVSKAREAALDALALDSSLETEVNKFLKSLESFK